MRSRLLGRDAPARGPDDEALLDEVRLVDALDRPRIHAERGRDRPEPDGPPDLEEVAEDLPILAVEPRIVDPLECHGLEDRGDIDPGALPRHRVRAYGQDEVLEEARGSPGATRELERGLRGHRDREAGRAELRDLDELELRVRHEPDDLREARAKGLGEGTPLGRGAHQGEGLEGDLE